MIARLIRAAKLVRLRLLQIELDGYELVGNDNRAMSIAPREALLRAELSDLRSDTPLSSIEVRDAYEIPEAESFVNEPGRFAS